MSARCNICDKPHATAHDDATTPEGKGEHLCWRDYGSDCKSHDWRTECLTLRAGVERLRGLIAEVEWNGPDGSCPWCDRWYMNHAPDCRAFSARGEVKR